MTNRDSPCYYQGTWENEIRSHYKFDLGIFHGPGEEITIEMGAEKDRKVVASAIVDARELPLDRVPSAAILQRLRDASGDSSRDVFVGSNAFNSAI